MAETSIQPYIKIPNSLINYSNIVEDGQYMLALYIFSSLFANPSNDFIVTTTYPLIQFYLDLPSRNPSRSRSIITQTLQSLSTSHAPLSLQSADKASISYNIPEIPPSIKILSPEDSPVLQYKFTPISSEAFTTITYQQALTIFANIPPSLNCAKALNIFCMMKNRIDFALSRKHKLNEAQGTLATHAGMSAKTFAKYIDFLSSTHLLRITHQANPNTGTTNTYDILPGLTFHAKGGQPNNDFNRS